MAVKNHEMGYCLTHLITYGLCDIRFGFVKVTSNIWFQDPEGKAFLAPTKFFFQTVLS